MVPSMQEVCEKSRSPEAIGRRDRRPVENGRFPGSTLQHIERPRVWRGPFPSLRDFSMSEKKKLGGRRRGESSSEQKFHSNVARKCGGKGPLSTGACSGGNASCSAGPGGGRMRCQVGDGREILDDARYRLKE